MPCMPPTEFQSLLRKLASVCKAAVFNGSGDDIPVSPGSRMFLPTIMGSFLLENENYYYLYLLVRMQLIQINKKLPGGFDLPLFVFGSARQF